MNGILRQSCFMKKLSCGFQTLSHPKPFNSQTRKQTPQNKRLDRALRVLDLIAPKPCVTPTRQTHLRLVQNILQTASNQDCSDDFDGSNSTVVIPDAFDEILQLSSRKNMIPKRNLQREPVGVDANVLSHAVSSYGSTRNLRAGIQYHCLAIRTGFVDNVYVGSSLISLYGKCAELENAYRVFEEMPVRNVVSWTAIISGFAQEWQVDVCLGLFHRMRNSTLEPNEFTFTSLLSACTGSGALGHGRSAHCQTVQMGFDSYVHIANALISMYCKCGAVEDALYIFGKMDGKDIVSWNSMIAGYALHGLALQAIDLFGEMKKQNAKPDAITFLGVLSSCRHAGLVKEGWFYFNWMAEHGVQPELDHYSCVVDLLGRAGLLEVALDFIKKMPIYPNAVIWGSLLSSSRLHGSVWIGIQAAENRLLLEPGCPATLVQLANLYASVGYWDRAATVRKLMKDRGLKTNPGCSWVEIKDGVYQFRVEDCSNTRLTEILAVLDILVDHMRTLGYEPDMHEEEVDNVMDPLR
ncbi:pentatricopeptide repeat-containing protein At2g37320 [Corylus avellana]|uniref:pentatricopeptide repeat-containing protein At2g37320 n=1 Tax=Corylus avellana TaxID=13451 RepID=UPI00286C60CB|nr:pentatricopeptide repeat-containing protein At2g37320 [Corylus avellana]